jgi:O-antigen/teichoic acid export membrane protein
LSPEDFGTVATVTLVLQLVSQFSESGLTFTLIQKKDADELDFHTAFWFVLGVSACLGMLVFAAAPWISAYYGDPVLTPVTRWLAVGFLSLAFNLVPEAMEIKRLSFNKIAASEVLSFVVSGAGAVTLAWLRYGLWSLVVFEASRRFVRAAFLMAAVRWKPGGGFSFTRLRLLLSTSVHFLNRQIITYFSDNIDGFLIAKLLGPAALGVYNMAYKICGYPVMKLWGIFGEMLLPTFVRMGEDKERLKRNFFRVSLGGGIVVVPFLLVIVFGSGPIIRLLLGEVWLPALPVIVILSVYLMLTGISFADESVLILFHGLKFMNGFKVVCSIVLLAAGLAAARLYGVVGVAATYTLVSSVYALVVKRVLLKRLGVPLSEYFRSMGSLFIFCGLLSVSLAFYARAVSLEPAGYLAGECMLALMLSLAYIWKIRLVNLKNGSFEIDRLFAP